MIMRFFLVLPVKFVYAHSGPNLKIIYSLFRAGVDGVWKRIPGQRRKEAQSCSVTGPKVENDGNRNAGRRTESGRTEHGNGSQGQNVICARVKHSSLDLSPVMSNP